MYLLPFYVFFAGLILALTTVADDPQRVSKNLPTTLVQADTVIFDNADRFVRTQFDGGPVSIFEGNVRMRQKNIRLRAHKVTEFLTKDEYLLEGDVLIIQETDSISADNVRYDSARKIGYATGNVRLSDGEVQVFSPSATHYTDDKWTQFNEPVRLVDSVTVLTSLKGAYFSESKRAEFYEDVILEEDNTYLKSDSITYYRETEISLGYGNVFIERIEGDSLSQKSTSRTFLFGDYIYNDNNTGYSLIEGNAFLFQVEEDSLGILSDSLLIESDRLEAIRDDSLQRLIAVDSVSIWRSDFSAIADSVVYDRIQLDEDDLFVTDTLGVDSTRLHEENRLFGDPVAWFVEYQLSGDSLLATAKEGAIDSLFASQNAFVAYLDTTTQKINQLQGLSLVGLFDQDSLESLTVGPQAEAIYFQESEEGQVGALKATGDRIHLSFSSNELNGINVYSGVQGEYYDGGLVPASFQLSGYRWLIDQKPQEQSMLDRIPMKANIDERLTPTLPLPVVREGAQDLVFENQ